MHLSTGDYYLLADSLAEQQRLLLQGEELRREAEWLLDRVAVQPGWRVADVGCGPLGILDLLAPRVGPAGEVIGIERLPHVAAMAREAVARRGLARVRIVEGNVADPGLALGAFDLVHARCVLINLTDPAPVLAAMLALVRPGGVIACQEVDLVSLLCEPPHPAWDALLREFHAAAEGRDLQIGRHLPALLRAAGLCDVRVEAHLRVAQPGEYYRAHLPALFAAVEDRVVARGQLSRAQAAELRDAVVRHVSDPATIVLRLTLFQVWARKPVA